MIIFLLEMFPYFIVWVIAGVFFKILADKSNYDAGSKFFDNPIARIINKGAREKVSDEGLHDILNIRNTFFIVSVIITVIKLVTLLCNIESFIVDISWKHNVEIACAICLCRTAASLYRDAGNYPMRLLLYTSLASTIAAHVLSKLR